MKVAFAASLALAASLTASLPAGADPTSTARIEDRTVVCNTQIVAGVRKFSVFFQPLLPPSASLPQGLPASVSVSTGFVAASRGLVFATAGPKAAFARPRIDMRRCGRTTTPVALSARGLPGPPVRFQQGVDCKLPGRIVVRARMLSDAGRVTRAEVAVRMASSGVPIAYARIARDGSGALYTSPRCE